VSTSKRSSRWLSAYATRNTVRLWKRLALVALLAIWLGLTSTPISYAQPSSTPPVVTFTLSEADSILARIDNLEVRVWELNRLAELDSLYYVERLESQAKVYEEIIKAYKDERPNWLERLAKQPVLWLALGMYIGVQADGP
jgi:hypothetical protein